VRAVHHHNLRQVLLPQRLPSSLNTLLIEVGTLASTTQNNKAVFVTSRPGNSSQTLLRHTQEVVLRSRSANRINRHRQTSIGTVLKSNREREPRCQLAVQLRLRCSRADSAEGDEVREELGGDCVEHLGRNGHTRRSKIDEQLARHPQSFVNFVALVNVGVIDESFPANRCPWLLEVGAHDDAEVVSKLVGKSLETLAVLERELWVVQRAWADHDKETVIFLSDDVGGIFAALDYSLLGVGGDRDLGGEELGWDERVISKDYVVISACELWMWRICGYVPRTSSLGLVESSKEGMSACGVFSLEIAIS
jgi:hypothetical protein